jgi:hypothetical protein
MAFSFIIHKYHAIHRSVAKVADKVSLNKKIQHIINNLLQGPKLFKD